MTPLDQIIREDLLDKSFVIDRKLFPFLNRCLNAEGYRCLAVRPNEGDRFVSIMVMEDNPKAMSEKTG